MFISPLLAAVLVGTFWTGVGVSAVANNNDIFDHSRSDVVITAQTSDHETACAAKYRSYNVDNDSYMGFDGSWHVCPL